MASGLYIAASASESEALNALTQASTTALGRMQHRVFGGRWVARSCLYTHPVAVWADRIDVDRGSRGSGSWAWLRRPELDQVGVGVEEVGADALGRVHVSGLLRTHGDRDALPPQVLDGALEICRIDLQSKMEPAREARVAHHPCLRHAQV